ncbi:tetratricopeptide repeat protein [Mesorhizobium sp. NZP2077]|uniref:tetratricopeptide repeat protein n=1 Tax=Mesorhizobium sp. NZP2077 TaxID=2483404 RepID=UPI0015551589|nr:tetratricopeptide repeat protein [Mesorhizobium sp. NZP2077]QKC84405.1 tetratricopeptide repeat protein [Mesorhizobium sp. NZP2077]QKD17965.1 tetratricopeptide repeat protein [Mesorhizobium sp. NZP2077]
MDRFNLGTYRRPISTHSTETLRWFDIGLNWCYGFNHEEGIKCFEKALETDPGCAMVHWGIAYAAGPFYNLTWKEHGEAEANSATKRCFEHVQLARANAAGASEVERQLIEALASRFQKPHRVSPQEFEQWDDAYAAAMRRVYESFPDDHDVMALLVEALMMRTVRRLWNLKTGAPAPNSDVLEALEVCERSIRLADEAGIAQHPAIVHLHIHLLEMSTMPERGVRSADLLGQMCPDAGHMNHMPGHIHVLCGDYEKAKLASEKAVRANDLYLAYADEPTYYLLGCCHDLHLMMFTCMFLGQYRPALWAADKVRSLVTRDVVSLPDRPKLTQTVEGYHAMKSHVQVRFGRWREIIDEPAVKEPGLYVLTAAMQHYAKGVAHATLKQFTEAERERDRFHRHLENIPAERRFLSNPTRASLAVGAALLDGELAYHQGRHEEAYAHLRQAVELDDNLSYTEPWAWMHPPRHALAALLLDQGHAKEAEQVYRHDLGLSGKVQRCAQHPDNVWALHGLVECLRRRGESEELPLLQAKLAVAVAKADVAISSSCLCRTSVQSVPSCCH